MSRRTWAGVLALPLVVALWLAALLVPLPYVTYSPGVTQNVLATPSGSPVIEVSGEKTHQDDGELLLTTVYVTRAERRVNIFEVMEAWFDRDDAVYPYDSVYTPGQTEASSQEQAAVQMASSQDVATAVALRSVGHEVAEVVKVASVDDDMPAAGRLEPEDVFVAVGDEPVTSVNDVTERIGAVPAGDAVQIEVERDGKRREVEVKPSTVDGSPRIGVILGQGFDFPIDVEVKVNPAIGGPSAGLIFALGINDVLTPGSLTGGGTVAGTGTMAIDGTVGPIGGIQQKIAASREQGAGIFLVPAPNCTEALGAHNGDMRLVRVDKFEDALASVQTWGENPDATLPTCERNADK